MCLPILLLSQWRGIKLKQERTNELVMVVAAPGGHLSVAKELMADAPFNVIYVVSRSGKEQFMEQGFEYVIESNRDLNFFPQTVQAARLIFKHRPKVIVSTGAGIAVPFFILAKLFSVPTVFIESASRVKKLSLSGSILYYISSRFYIRNEQLSKKYKRSINLS
jgi:beta-1,4-N-acetylglucosaminyltransferase